MSILEVKKNTQNFLCCYGVSKDEATDDYIFLIIQYARIESLHQNLYTITKNEN